MAVKISKKINKRLKANRKKALAYKSSANIVDFIYDTMSDRFKNCHRKKQGNIIIYAHNAHKDAIIGGITYGYAAHTTSNLTGDIDGIAYNDLYNTVNLKIALARAIANGYDKYVIANVNGSDVRLDLDLFK